MSYLRRKARGERLMTASAKRPRYQSRYLQVPLADELFECIQGPFKSFVDLTTPEGQEFKLSTIPTRIQSLVVLMT